MKKKMTMMERKDHDEREAMKEGLSHSSCLLVSFMNELCFLGWFPLQPKPRDTYHRFKSCYIHHITTITFCH